LGVPEQPVKKPPGCSVGQLSVSSAWGSPEVFGVFATIPRPKFPGKIRKSGWRISCFFLVLYSKNGWVYIHSKEVQIPLGAVSLTSRMTKTGMKFC
jgi:hypothetical protein